MADQSARQELAALVRQAKAAVERNLRTEHDDGCVPFQDEDGRRRLTCSCGFFLIRPSDANRASEIVIKLALAIAPKLLEDEGPAKPAESGQPGDLASMILGPAPPPVVPVSMEEFSAQEAARAAPYDGPTGPSGKGFGVAP